MFTPQSLGIPIIYTVLACVAVLWLVVTPLWIITMKKALETIAPQFRAMQPEQTWLAMIPIFGCLWQFMVTSAVANSFRNEYGARGIIVREQRPGASIGLSADIFFCTVLIPVYGLLFSLISFIPRLMHLFRIKNYTDHLQGLIDAHAMQMNQPVGNFNWADYQQKAEEAMTQINNADPERFKPKNETNEEPEKDIERWMRK